MNVPDLNLRISVIALQALNNIAELAESGMARRIALDALRGIRDLETIDMPARVDTPPIPPGADSGSAERGAEPPVSKTAIELGVCNQCEAVFGSVEKALAHAEQDCPRRWDDDPPVSARPFFIPGWRGS